MTLSILFLTLVALAGASFAKQPETGGKELYEKYCQRCHGMVGTRHLFGAKDLQKSTMEEGAVLIILQNGKRTMPSYKKKLSAGDLEKVKNYVLLLRR